MNITSLIEKASELSGTPEIFGDANTLKGHDFFFRAALILEKKSSRREAEFMYRAALEENPGHLPSIINLASICKSTGRIAEAFSLVSSALASENSVSELHEAMGNILTAAGKAAEALEEFKKALDISPNNLRLISNNLLTMNYVENISSSDLYKAHAEAGRRIGLSVKKHHHEKPFFSKQKLKLGFVSADFKRHSVAFFFEPVLSLLNRDEFEIFLYSDTKEYDDITSRIKGLGNWRDTTYLRDEEADELIKKDGIDILVDLSGHTAMRMRLFAMKPAPLQITWLGSPTTTGLSEMDWRITDELADLPGQESFHSEKLLRIPGGFQVYAPPADAPDVTEMPCIENSFFTFGSFNGLQKITPGIIQMWARILKSVSGSKLFLKANGLNDPAVTKYLSESFEKEGIQEDRIIFSGLTGTLYEHLKAYSRVDLALDTFPYNGVTTTCEALWMGVPVLTLAGERHTGRVGLSILKRLGLESFIAESKSSYIVAARAAALNTEVLRGLRQNLRKIMASSSLCDAVGFTRRFEEAIKTAWCDYSEAGDKSQV
ncbi:MAG: hypothetical protein A2020_13995 [Lentisphaerae bacterium GWF2_45_14]|nr:MAG: hypothetical protein A2020_13995 [Lentisphaerae bacterium GWF2_45_14]